jgi:hypothetical protein
LERSKEPFLKLIATFKLPNIRINWPSSSKICPNNHQEQLLNFMPIHLASMEETNLKISI